MEFSVINGGSQNLLRGKVNGDVKHKSLSKDSNSVSSRSHYASS